MKAMMLIGVLCTLAMLAALIYGFGYGNGWAEVRVLMDYPWFVVSLVDVYVGFILFACWIALREKPLVAVLWIVPLMTLGNVFAGIYFIRALLLARSGKVELGYIRTSSSQ
ncbi:MAG: DUF1475 domain-containing protein [Phycisphaerales bacterium]